jgi:hypothetical protein
LLGEANVENLISYFLPMLEKHLCLELKNYTIGALGRQKVNKVEPKHIHACKPNLLHKRLLPFTSRVISIFFYFSLFYFLALQTV